MYSLETIKLIDFELSSHCNSKCPQCPRYDMQGNVHQDLNVTHLSLDTIKKIPLKDMKSLENISFRGNFGDPLMHPKIDHIIDFFSEQNIHVSTNASLRDTMWWKKLGAKKNVEVMFCIDGLEDTHHLYRRHTSYEKIIDNAKSFIGAGGRALWQFIVFKHNEHQIEEARSLSKSLGFQSIKFMYSERFDVNSKFKVYEDNKHLYDLEKSSKQKLLREELGADDGEKYWKKLFLDRDLGKIECIWSHLKELYIHSDGNVYPCCMIGSIQAGKNIEKLMFEKIVKDSTKINLHKNSFETIISSDVFQKLIPDSLDGHPLSHPVCIEWCNKKTGKLANSFLNTVNT